MENCNFKKLSKIFAYLGITFFVICILLFVWTNAITLNSPLWGISEIIYNLLWIPLFVSIILGILWYVCDTISENIDTEKGKTEHAIQKREKEKAEEERKVLAYQEISDIWEYGNKTILAVHYYKTLKRGVIYNLRVDYSGDNETPWVISYNMKNVFDYNPHEFKAKRSGNSLVGIEDDKIAVMSEGKLTIGDKVLFFDLENNYVKKVKELMEQLLAKRKIEMIKFEHLKVAETKDIVDALPKYHFSFSEDGIMCDEINYPEKHLEDFFEKNNGGEHIFQNKIFYIDYCQYNYLYHFDWSQREELKKYMHEKAMQALHSGYSCKTDFELEEWQVAIKLGLENLFKSIKTYVDNKTLDVVPCEFNENGILFHHKMHALKKCKSMNQCDLAVSLMVESRKDEEPKYSIIKTDDGKIAISINGEKFISVDSVLPSNS